jgi:hypothetical protein
MTVARVTTRTYDPDSGNLACEVEVEITTPDPTPPAKPPAAVVTLRPAAGCPPSCAACAREARERMLTYARQLGFQVRYTPLRYSSPITTELSDALRRVFV